MEVLYATHCTDYEIAVTTQDTEYSLVLPAQVKALEMRCRDGTAFRHSFTQGKVASTTAPCQTVPANGFYSKEHLYLNAHTLYVAAGAGSKVVEVRVWL